MRYQPYPIRTLDQKRALIKGITDAIGEIAQIRVKNL
jgi:phenylpyruvate tautomerase PptA (4-oxalocrotonate tautomerase family)